MSNVTKDAAEAQGAMAAAHAVTDALEAEERQLRKMKAENKYSAGLAFLCFVMPPVGAIVAAVSMANSDPDTRRGGRRYLSCAVVGLFIEVIGGCIAIAIHS